MSPLLIHELRVMSPRNLVGVVHLPFLRSIINGDITLMYIFYIFITVEKTKSLYAYNGCLSLEIVRSSDVFIKHYFDKHI